MPTHIYQPTRNPPSWWDRLLVHSMDSTVAGVFLIFGALAAISLLAPDFIPSKSMDQMPLLVVILVSVFLAAGGVLSIIGLNWPGDVSTGWALERFGLLLSAGGFIAYAISVSWHYPESVFAWVVPLLLGLGGLLRCLSVLMIERHTRRTIAEVKGEIL
ncbi:hypothetical protein [Arthrobacter gengyunqii]|uniref:DUF2231 domain-containing protein n=1 Tax=Arthrobacter gengyunqii TaxID=2886940 RepID=A0ABS8GN42_9MICC|nr:hypothetical protein [Arthrobacter gengyunqii]MCC3266673.1 hypothetical protein [Arthrobacter gengyunqii]